VVARAWCAHRQTSERLALSSHEVSISFGGGGGGQSNAEAAAEAVAGVLGEKNGAMGFGKGPPGYLVPGHGHDGVASRRRRF
jgi:hypothetical protein